MKNKINKQINYKKNQIENFKDETLYEYVLKNVKNWNGWDKFFLKEDIKENLKKISDYLNDEVENKNYTISPVLDEVFESFIKTNPKTLKAFISGQDPAPEPHLADGLSFCIQGVDTSHVPSIQRVLLELNNEGYKCDPLDGDTSKWASNGVMMYNDALTIPFPPGSKEGIIGAHLKIWKDFSQKLFEFIDEELSQPMAFILWGSKAAKNKKYITRSNHKPFIGGHPSPEARSENFFCKNYFSGTNEFLKENGVEGVNWNLTPNFSKFKKGIYHWASRNRTSKWISECKNKEK